MVLKEAFRYQNVLAEWIHYAECILADRDNTTDVCKKYLFSKAKAEIQDVEERVERNSDCAFLDGNTTKLAEFAYVLLEERERVARAIFDAKKYSDFVIDVEVSMNSCRRSFLHVLRNMVTIKDHNRIIRSGGTGYTFNNDMNQVEFKCDVEESRRVNFDRDKIRNMIKELESRTDDVSTKVDVEMVSMQVDCDPMFDTNDTLEEVFMAWLNG